MVHQTLLVSFWSFYCLLGQAQRLRHGCLSLMMRGHEHEHEHEHTRTRMLLTTRWQGMAGVVSLPSKPIHPTTTAHNRPGGRPVFGARLHNPGARESAWPRPDSSGVSCLKMISFQGLVITDIPSCCLIFVFFYFPSTLVCMAWVRASAHTND